MKGIFKNYFLMDWIDSIPPKAQKIQIHNQ